MKPKKLLGWAFKNPDFWTLVICDKTVVLQCSGLCTNFIRFSSQKIYTVNTKYFMCGPRWRHSIGFWCSDMPYSLISCNNYIRPMKISPLDTGHYYIIPTTMAILTYCCCFDLNDWPDNVRALMLLARHQKGHTARNNTTPTTTNTTSHLLLIINCW